MLYLRTFGGLSIENGGQAITGAAGQRGRLAILAVLAAAGDNAVSRDRLYTIFWPESDTERARGALKQALYSLRRDLKQPELTVGISDLRLNRSIVSSDASEFTGFLRADDLHAAVALYRGPFLDGIHLKESREFESWAEAERTRFRLDFTRAVEILAKRAADSGDPGEAVGWWQKLCLQDPLSSSACVGLINALLEAGDIGRALEQATSYEARFRAEFGSPPDERLMALFRGIRIMPPAATPGANSTRSPALPAPPVDTPASLVPLTPAAQSGRTTPWLAVAAVIGLAIATSVLWAMRSPATNPRTIAVLVTSQGTATPLETARLVRDGLLARLGELRAHALRTIPSNHQVVLKQRADVLGVEEASRMATEQHARFLLVVSARQAGDSLLLTSGITDARLRTQIGIEPSLTSTKQLESALDRLGSRLKAVLAARMDRRFQSWSHAAAMPRTHESFLELSRGMDLVAQSDALSRNLAAADSHFFRAATLDSSSATPLVWAAFSRVIHGRRGVDSVLAAIRKSARRLGPWDDAMIGYVGMKRRGDLDGIYNAAHNVAKVVPRSEWVILSADAALYIGRAGEAVRTLKSVAPDSGWIQNWWGYWLWREQGEHMLGAFEDELSDMRRQPQSKTGAVGLKPLAAMGRVAEIEAAWLEALPKRPYMTGQPFDQTALELRAHGFVAHADRMDAWLLKHFASLPDSIARHNKDWLADILLRMGRLDAAEALVDSLLERRPAEYQSEDRREYLWQQKAQIAARRGDRRAALAAWGQIKSARVSDRSHMSYFDEANLYALLGEKDHAVELLARAYQNGSRGRPTGAHLMIGFMRLRGYPPLDALIDPVDAPVISRRAPGDVGGR